MKNIFRKLHIGTGHDPNRSEEVPSVPALISGAAATSCASDHRTATAAPPALPAMNPPSPPEGVSAAAAVERVDYFSTEEEFQMQLALAISASNSEFRDDPDSDQIRIATLLSLGTSRGDEGLREEEPAESQARRYWDYNVLDYDEKVVDGFYDIFGLSTNLNRGKMPSLHDLQTSIGDIGFEVIIVNRAVDTALVELEQVAHCIALDVPATEVTLLVQRISELVSQNMGGPVKDANDILARWMEKSSELRTSLQTSLLPISFIDVGLSRHRALLFKVLADNIGIPCKLVKGSHYTGVDEDAINIIKFGDNREFLVDLMAAPGTLIPADMLSTKDTTSIPFCSLLNENVLGTAIDHSGDDFRVGNNRYFNLDGDTMLGTRASTEKAVLLSSVLGESSSTVSSSSGNTESFYLHVLSNQLSSSISEASKQASYKVPEFVSMKEKLKERSSGDALERNLFAELNPFQTLGVGKYSSAFEADYCKTNEYLKPRESVASGPERPQHQSPLVRKNHAPCNDSSNFSVGLPRKKNLGFRDLNSSHYTSSATGSSLANPFNCSGIACSVRPDDTSSRNPDCSSGAINNSGFVQNCKIAIGGFDPPADEVLVPIQFKEHGLAFHNNVIHKHKERDKNIHEPKEGDKNINANRDRKRLLHDKFLDSNMASGDANQSSPSAHDKFIGSNEGSHVTNPSASLSLCRPNRIDPMLDDVAEWELPWEDLIIGERIGLGSYGEVYRADWNGTEVAVKKFLDQDFYGDALDEFRSEVRIMRRLRHPNVVLFMGAVTRPPNLSIVSEFLPRGSLYKILHRPNCQIDEKRRIKMALDVAKGMNCLHTSAPTIVHRDLKSPNLLVAKNWTVKVCDFGLSRLKHNTFLSSKSTAGTPEWMAPEVLRNEPSNEKCDIYSFGVILWELATLRMPWSGMNPMQVVGAVGFQERRLEIPKEVDPLVGRIIWECWQTDPSLRPSFAQLTTALKSLQRLVIPLHHDPHIASVPVQISVNSTP